MMKNIIWILCDSVRVYHTNEDERGRLNIMDKFAKESVDFRVAVTAAPSTVMSVSAMMTGIPAPFISRDYNGFKGQQSHFTTFPNVLKNHGYNIYSLLCWQDGRDFLGPLMGDTCPELMENKYPSGYIYENDDMLDVFQEFLNSERVNDRFFVWLHLNCRGDAELSDKVEILLEDLKQRGHYDDTIIVMNSDHGYPDPSRGISFYDKQKYGHDLIMTDDNILAPQLIKFPDIKPIRVDKPISTLDVFPTILDYLNIPLPTELENYPIHGISQMGAIKDNEDIKERILRIDNRYAFQENVVVALRDSRYKYINYIFEEREEFYDIEKDPLESNNIIKSDIYKSDIGRFQKELISQQREIENFHASQLMSKLNNHELGEESLHFIGSLSSIAQGVFKKLSEGAGYNYSIENLDEGIVKINLLKSQAKILFVMPCTKDHVINSKITEIASQFGSNFERIQFINYNMDLIDKPNHWIFKAIKKIRSYYWIYKNDSETAKARVKLDLIRLKEILFK